jgi:hypothetical protein
VHGTDSTEVQYRFEGLRQEFLYGWRGQHDGHEKTSKYAYAEPCDSGIKETTADDGFVRVVYRSITHCMHSTWRTDEADVFTSLTTAVGFSMLAWADIPPVKVFGLFVASGVMVARVLSMTLFRLR